jgi:cellulose synthase/poly-beta-1,6-N-acetylglucosamine synthase-like glycosyltransferase
MIGFYLLASLVIIQGLVALWEGVRFLKFVRQSLAHTPTDYTPKVAVIAPCKGLDPGFRENIRSLLGQDYPDYEITFVTESKTDPAYGQIQRILQEESFPHATLIVAGRASACGQKVHNLLVALEHVSDDVQVLAFVDSDARPPTHWLRSLVAPLSDPAVGATTGYRWYIPSPGNIYSLIRSLWNASIATALGPHNRNFTWGGSTAIRRDTFDAANIRALWLGVCTEDYVLSNAVKARGLWVKFVPQCLIPSFGACGLRELLQFTTRQIILTRIYSFRLWLLGLIANLMFAGVFYTGLGIVVYRQRFGMNLGVPELVLIAMYLPGIIKSILRQQAVEMILTYHLSRWSVVSGQWSVVSDTNLKRYRLAHYFLYPLASLVYVYNFVVSAVSRRIEWRGIRYKLISPTETLILGED